MVSRAFCQYELKYKPVASHRVPDLSKAEQWLWHPKDSKLGTAKGPLVGGNLRVLGRAEVTPGKV